MHMHLLHPFAFFCLSAVGCIMRLRCHKELMLQESWFVFTEARLCHWHRCCVATGAARNRASICEDMWEKRLKSRCFRMCPDVSGAMVIVNFGLWDARVSMLCTNFSAIPSTSVTRPFLECKVEQAP